MVCVCVYWRGGRKGVCILDAMLVVPATCWEILFNVFSEWLSLDISLYSSMTSIIAFLLINLQ